MSEHDLRKHPRYESDVPIDVFMEHLVASESIYLNNISEGGLSFNSLVAVDIGSVMRIRVPVNRPVFEMLGRVVWCKEMTLQFVVGVEFMNMDEDGRRQVVELVRSIEAYKQDVKQREGRALSGQQAALEWLALSANRSP